MAAAQRVRDAVAAGLAADSLDVEDTDDKPLTRLEEEELVRLWVCADTLTDDLAAYAAAMSRCIGIVGVRTPVRTDV